MSSHPISVPIPVPKALLTASFAANRAATWVAGSAWPKQ